MVKSLEYYYYILGLSIYVPGGLHFLGLSFLDTLVPVRHFPSPCWSIHFGDVSKVNGQ